jgi:hypothetical protein
VWVREPDPERAAALAGRLTDADLRVSLTRLRTEPASIATMHTLDASQGTS